MLLGLAVATWHVGVELLIALFALRIRSSFLSIATIAASRSHESALLGQLIEALRILLRVLRDAALIAVDCLLPIQVLQLSHGLLHVPLLVLALLSCLVWLSTSFWLLVLLLLPICELIQLVPLFDLFKLIVDRIVLEVAANILSVHFLDER